MPDSWREPTWEEDRDELAAHLAFMHRTLREAGHFPEAVDPEDCAIWLTLNYLRSSLDTASASGGYSPSAEKVRRVLGLPHEPPPLTLQG